MTNPDKLWRRAVLPVTATIREAVSNLNEVGIQIVMILNEHDGLAGTLSDGDIRRGLLKGLGLDGPITSIINRNPLVVPEGIERDLVTRLMTANKVRQIPIVDQNNQLTGLHLWHEIAGKERDNIIVIMAGGMGKRMRPHTESCPKPMLPIAGKPILEHIVERAKIEGFRHFVLTVHYLGHMIEEHFRDGRRFGVHIEYIKEETPMGTAGALSLLHPRPEFPLVVTNGDVITDVRYGELLDFHSRHDAVGTMAVGIHEWQHPFGVVRIDGVDIISFEEKPVVRSHINAGVYALSPIALNSLDEAEHCDMPTLFEKLQARGERTVAYPMHEPWLDVGRPDDFMRAVESLKK